AEQFAGGGVDDADVQVLDEQQDVGSGVGSAGADVVELAGVAEGDGAGFADDVGADAVMGVGGPIAGGGLGPGGLRGGGAGPGRRWAGRHTRWRGWRGRAVTCAAAGGCSRR